MLRVVKGLGVVALLVGGLGAQYNTDTTWATITTGYQGALPALLPIPSPTQIGATTHTITAGIRNAPSKTCSTTLLIARLQVSEDNVNWFVPNGNVSQTAATLILGTGYVYQTQSRLNGSYPYIRVLLNSFDTTNCVADVFYFGNKSNTTFNTQNFSSAPQTFNTTGDHNLVSNNTGNQICLRGLILWNVTTAQTVKLTDGSAGSTILGPWTSLPAGTSIILPQILDQSSSYGCTSAGTNNLVINLSANTEVDVTAFFSNQ